MTEMHTGTHVDSLVDDYYARSYQNVHASGGLRDAARIMHTALEKRHVGKHWPVTLELGSGQFQHYPYVRHSRDRYIAADLRSPADCPMLDGLTSGAGPADLTFLQANATRLPFRDASVDRIVATCLLLHLPDPLAAVREWQRVCTPTGVIDLLVPCEPGIALRVFRVLVSHRVARARGVSPADFDLVNALDHINYFGRAIAATKAALTPGRRLEARYYPFRVVPSWNLNAFAVFSITAAVGGRQNPR